MKLRSIRVDGVADLEAEAWSTFVVGGFGFSGTYREYWWDDDDGESRLAEDLLSFRGTVWAHFGGGYDYKWLLDIAVALGEVPRLVTAGSHIVSLRIRAATFCDSFRLAPMSLAKLTRGLGVEKAKLELPCRCGSDCGGYCSIRRKMPRKLRRRLSTYLGLDLGSLETALNHLREFGSRYDLDLGCTVGSSAWRNVRRRHGVPKATLSGSDYDFAKEAYYGAKTEMYRRRAPSGWGHDVNAMYPHCLATYSQPVGEFLRETGRAAARRYEDGAPGVYRAVVEVPEMFIPPLPKKCNRGTTLSFPWGTFEGHWVRDELKHAETRGIRVQVVESMTWEREARLFSPWIRDLWRLRLHCACPRGLECSIDAPHHNPDSKNTPLGIWLKFLMNSMIGKLGSNPEQEKWLLNPPRDKIRLCDCPIGEACSGGHHRQVSERCFVSTEYKILDCSHVEWAAVGLANARVELDRFHKLVDDGEDMVYSDTDNGLRTSDVERLFPEWASARVGDDLGQWQPMGPFEDFVAVAPKVYSYTSRKGGKRELVARAKGVTLPTKKDGDKKVFLGPPEVGRKYVKEGIVGFRLGARLGKFFERTRTERTLSERSGSRLWEPSPHSRHAYPPGCTYPPHVSDLRP